MCAERGNYWSTREIVTEGPSSRVRFITIEEPDLGEIKIVRPSCELFRGPMPEHFHPMVRVNGEAYFYFSKNDEGYIFFKRSEKSRVGKTCVRKCIFRGWPET